MEILGPHKPMCLIGSLRRNNPRDKSLETISYSWEKNWKKIGKNRKIGKKLEKNRKIEKELGENRKNIRKKIEKSKNNSYTFCRVIYPY